MIEHAREIVVLATLAVAGFFDYRTREIDDKIWVVGAAVTAPFLLSLNPESLEFKLYIVSLTIALLICLIVLKFKMMGEADAIALAYLAFAEPPSLRSFLTLFPPATVIAVAGLLSLAYAAYNVTVNMRRRAPFEEGTPLALKILALTTMRFITLEEYHKKSYMYTPVEKLSTALTLKPLENSSHPRGDKFWAVVGMPYVTLLAAGYAVYLALRVIPVGA